MNTQKYSKELEQIHLHNPGAVLGEFVRVRACRACRATRLNHFLSLGLVPLPNGFIPKKHLHDAESYYPLNVSFCSKCGMVQLDEIISSSKLFNHYVYASAASLPMVQHLEKVANVTTRQFKLTGDDLVLDIGSNDGTFLSFFKKNGTKILGIDPAKNIAKDANDAGIPTIADFFSKKSARDIYKKYGQASLITIFNVLAQIPDWDSVFSGVKRLLSPNGVFMIEFPYIVDTLTTLEFDTMYHEHLSFISVSALSAALKRAGLAVFDVKHEKIHGGSLRVYVTHEGKRAKTDSVSKYIKIERSLSIFKEKIYKNYATHVYFIREKMSKLLNSLANDKKRIVAYGATAKGTILLNFCNINPKIITAIIDSTPYKHGLYSPGTHILVVPEKKLDELKPDFALLTAWNYTKEILEKNEERRKKGLKFIRPYPVPTIL